MKTIIYFHHFFLFEIKNKKHENRVAWRLEIEYAWKVI